MRSVKKKKYRVLSFFNYKIEFINYFLLFCVLFLILLFANCIFMYSDLANTISNSIIFGHCATHGDLLNFYDISVRQTVTDWAATYNVPVYILFSIWNLPVYLIFKARGGQFNVEWTSSPMISVWSKTLVLLFSLLVAYMIYRIIYICTQNTQLSLIGTLLYLSSLLALFPSSVAGQLESISMFFMLLGLYFFLTNKNLLFFLAFLFAAPFKLFAILLELPLLVLKEKNIFKAGGIWIASTSLLILEKIIFHGSEAYHYALGAQSESAFLQIAGSDILIGNGKFSLSLFIIIYVIVLVYAYTRYSYTKYHVIYISLLVWFSFIAFVNITFYWIYLLVPFIILALTINNYCFSLSVVVTTIGELSYFIVMLLRKCTIFTDRFLLSRTLLPKIISIPSYSLLRWRNLPNYLANLGFSEEYTPAFFSIFVGAVISLLYLTNPRNQVHDKEVKIDAGILIWLWIRALFSAFFIILLLYAGLKTTNPIAVSTMTESDILSDCDLTDSISSPFLMQKVDFSEDSRLDELTLKFHNTYQSRHNMSRIIIEIWDMTENKCVFTAEKGAYYVPNDESFRINLNKTPINHTHKYGIKLSGTPATQYDQDNDSIYPYITDTINKDLPAAVTNNGTLTGNLFFQIQ